MAEEYTPPASQVEENCEDIIGHWDSRLPADFDLDGEDNLEYKAEFAEFRALIAATEKMRNDYEKSISARDDKAKERHAKNKKYRPAINVRFDKSSPEYQSSPTIYDSSTSKSESGQTQSGNPPLPTP